LQSPRRAHRAVGHGHGNPSLFFSTDAGKELIDDMDNFNHRQALL
jgi:hypothetical protein